MHDSQAGFKNKIIRRVSMLFHCVYNGYVNTESSANKYDGKILLKIVVDKMTVISKCPVFIMVVDILPHFRQAQAGDSKSISS